MTTNLKKITIPCWELQSGLKHTNYWLFYETFGPELGTAPVVLVNHALTGNSNVVGKTGWWHDLIGENKAINTQKYTIIAFNIPGNGYDGNPANLIDDYKNCTVKDIAQVFWQGLSQLNVKELYAAIGGSLGGALAWQMAVLHPTKIKHLIPIATDWKATDWVIANALIQDNILNHSSRPLFDARMHAMLLYRTPHSLKQKFNRGLQPNSDLFQIESWLNRHGQKLQNRFELASYKLMNYLLRTIDISQGKNNFIAIAKEITAAIHIIAVDTDCLFIADENKEDYKNLKAVKENVFYNEIKSIHGHDAFLIEYEQLSKIVAPLFN
jgi:homoserine O-acetyltransferase/O-succinyltransferase